MIELRAFQIWLSSVTQLRDSQTNSASAPCGGGLVIKAGNNWRGGGSQVAM